LKTSKVYSELLFIAIEEMLLQYIPMWERNGKFDFIWVSVGITAIK
jgi:hypothetical protein